MNPLEHIHHLQNELQKRLGTWDKIKNDSDRQQFVNQNLLAIFEETVEVMRCTAYKNSDVMPFGWKKTQLWNKEEFLKELVDLDHFITNLYLVGGFTWEDRYKAYCSKNGVNHERQDKNY